MSLWSLPPTRARSAAWLAPATYPRWAGMAQLPLCTSSMTHSRPPGQVAGKQSEIGIPGALPTPPGFPCQAAWWASSLGVTEKPGTDFRARDTLPRKSSNAAWAPAVTGRPPLPRRSRETSRSGRWSRPSTSPGPHRCGCGSSPRRPPEATAPACPAQRSCTWPLLFR